MPRRRMFSYALEERFAKAEKKDAADARFLRAFCQRHFIYDGKQIVDRVFIPFDQVDKYGLCSELKLPEKSTLTEEQRNERRAYEILSGKPFAPETFLHRSLSVWFVRELTMTFGSRKCFKAAIQNGHVLLRDGAYVAWLYGFITRAQLQQAIAATPVRRNTRKFLVLKKKRKRG